MTTGGTERPHVLALETGLPTTSPAELAGALHALVRRRPGAIPLDDHCRSGGTAQDAVVGAVTVDRCDAVEANGTMELTFTEVLPVGCADLRLHDSHRVSVRFRYCSGAQVLEIERGFPSREYDPEEF